MAVFILGKSTIFLYQKAMKLAHIFNVTLRGASSLLIVSFLGVLSSCQSTLQKAPTGGKFQGEPRMVSVAPNTFFFYQAQDAPAFTFTTAKEAPADSTRKRGRGKYGPHLRGLTIRPEAMLTTGASTPRWLWQLPGYAAFDFTRAALIHDWLYEAHHRYEMGKYFSEHGTTQQQRDHGNEMMNTYRSYAELTQDDAADIFAECIRAIMVESDRISGDLIALRQQELAQNRHTVGRIDDILRELRNTRSKARKLWTYHYFVSSDCLARTASKMWAAHHDDLGLYRILAEGGAVNKGYISPWLQEQFRKVYAMKKRDVETADKIASVQASDVQSLRPRIYLDVSSRAAEAAVFSRKNDLASFDLKKARSLTSVNPTDLRIFYYRAEDKEEAQSLLDQILGFLPADQRPADARVAAATTDSLYRPRHYDLRIGGETAALLMK